MRALAHPARLSILELLHANGTANATECARELGGSPQAASYHLRALAKWGLIARADSTDGRETRWELAARAITFAEGDGSPQYRRAARALGRRVLERDDRIVADYIEAEPDELPEWREAATLSSGTLYVTAGELAAIADQVRALMKQYERTQVSERPEGSRRAHIVFRAVPRTEPKPKRRR